MAPWRRTSERWLLLPLLCTLVGATTASGQGDVLLRGSPHPLFEADSVLHLTLRTDLKTVVRDRDTLTRRYHPATVTYREASGLERSVQAELRTRGHWRLQRHICEFPPLRVRFRDGTAGSVFEGEKVLKLVTTCQRRSDRYEQFVLQEYLLYRVYRLLTPYSFRVRLARITYEDGAGKVPTFTRHAFFLEQQETLAERNGGYVMDVDAVRKEQPPVRIEEAARLAVFQYLIANTDWSILNQHNVRLVFPGSGAAVPVPYDFDWSGVINAPYADPNPAFPIRSVRERLYRGYCISAGALEPILAHFKENRPGIYALLHSVPALEPARLRDMEKFFDSFFQRIDDRAALEREIQRGCIGRK